MATKKEHLIHYLEQEAADARKSETFSRNGESTEFHEGEFSGREQLANEIVNILKNGCNFKRVNGKIQPVEQ